MRPDSVSAKVVSPSELPCSIVMERFLVKATTDEFKKMMHRSTLKPTRFVKLVGDATIPTA